jgi:hypothetical protein
MLSDEPGAPRYGLSRPTVGLCYYGNRIYWTARAGESLGYDPFLRF